MDIEKLSKNSDIMMAVAVVGIILMLIIPMPSELLDFLLVVNIASAIIILIISIYIAEPLDSSLEYEFAMMLSSISAIPSL